MWHGQNQRVDRGDIGRVRAASVLVTLALAVYLVAPPAAAHHILGVPHYAYDEDYPQTPVLTYRVDAGPCEVKMTGYPGRPKPRERCSLHVYIQRLDDGTPFSGDVTLTVFQDTFVGQDPVVYGPVTTGLEEAVYKFYPQFAVEADYIVRIAYEAEGAPWIIDLPMVVGEPGSPWMLLGAAGGGVVAFLVVIRAVRIKMRRRGFTQQKTQAIETVPRGKEVVT